MESVPVSGFTPLKIDLDQVLCSEALANFASSRAFASGHSESMMLK
jgi:hypothetical protein